MDMLAKTVKGGMVAAALSLAVFCGSAQAGVVFTDSFESPTNTRNWQVYQTFGDWTSTGGSGIEIQRSGVVVGAHTGSQYVELDSDTSRGGVSGDGTNSSMTRALNLSAGTYTLDYFYQPRTNRAGDNLIEVFLDGASDSLMTTMIGSSDGVSSVITGWIKQSITFSVDGLDNTYALTFAAGGRENTLGGFLDTVSLTRNVPAPGGFAFLVLGLFGLGVAMRCRRS